MGVTAARTGPPRPRRYDGDREPLRTPRPVRRAPRAGGSSAPGRVAAARRAAARAAGARRAAAPAASSSTTSSRPGPRRSSDRARTCRRRRSSSSSRARPLVAGTPAFETAAADAMRDIAERAARRPGRAHTLAPRQVSADGHTAYDIVFLDLPPDDSPDALPILARAPPRSRAGLDRRARRRPGVLRRRPGGLGGGPAAQRADLAAAGRARAVCRVRVAGRGGRPARGRRGGGHRRARGDLRSSPRSRR